MNLIWLPGLAWVSQNSVWEMGSGVCNFPSLFKYSLYSKACVLFVNITCYFSVRQGDTCLRGLLTRPGTWRYCPQIPNSLNRECPRIDNAWILLQISHLQTSVLLRVHTLFSSMSVGIWICSCKSKKQMLAEVNGRKAVRWSPLSHSLSLWQGLGAQQAGKVSAVICGACLVMWAARPTVFETGWLSWTQATALEPWL